MTSSLHRHFKRAARRPWDCPQLQTWQDNRTEVERAREKAVLTALFIAAEKSPTALQALNWAKAHDVVFIVIDDPSPHVAGFMLPGSGAVVINAKILDAVGGEDAVLSYLTHEIRHIWQDYHGLLPYMKAENIERLGVRQYLLRNALCEADAHAHDQLVRWELDNNLGADRKTKRDLMQKYFLEWPGRWKVPYAARVIAGHAQVWRVDMPVAANQDRAKQGKIDPAFPPYSVSTRTLLEVLASSRRSGAGIDSQQRAQLEQLGRSFAGGNYIVAIGAHNLPRVFTDMGVKLADHLAARPQDASLIAAVRKREIRHRQSRFPLTRMPLPKDLKKGQ